jgi:hypothetical protein
VTRCGPFHGSLPPMSFYRMRLPYLGNIPRDPVFRNLIHFSSPFKGKVRWKPPALAGGTSSSSNGALALAVAKILHGPNDFAGTPHFGHGSAIGSSSSRHSDRSVPRFCFCAKRRDTKSRNLSSIYAKATSPPVAPRVHGFLPLCLQHPASSLQNVTPAKSRASHALC